jgi:hypothetical protein
MSGERNPERKSPSITGGDSWHLREENVSSHTETHRKRMTSDQVRLILLCHKP